jgi:quinol-cytochrome oxidoreductase complex cytochrome b subunit
METREMQKGFWYERLGLAALRYPMPAAATALRYNLGALTFASFVTLVLTGLWLAQFYNPSPAGAHDSVVYIITRAPLGDFVRSLHYWSASAMVVSIVAHIGWGLYSRAYRAPREITWYAGLGLAALAFLMVVTGTILRYDQEGYEALAHFVAGAGLTGGSGAFFAPEFTLSAPLLARIFSLHTSLLPLSMAVLVGLHFWLVRVHGVSAEGPKSATFSGHLPRIAGVSLILFAALVALAVVAPVGLGQAPVAGYEITKPFWPVLWIYAMESLTGMWAVVWAPLVVFAFLALVPLFDRGTGGRPVIVRAVGAALLLVLLALGLWAALSPPQQHLGM